MTLPMSEETAQALLRSVNLEAKAATVISEPLVPKWAEYAVWSVVGGTATFIGLRFDGQVVNIVAGVAVAGFIGLALHVWGLQRRLDAVVVLLRALEARNRD